MVQKLLSAVFEITQTDPTRPAVITHGRQLSYDQLGEQSDLISRKLQEIGIGEGSVVGLLLERSPESIVAFFGVLKSGGAFVPLDPTDPPGRVARVLEECHAQCVVTIETLKERLPAAHTVLVVQDLLADRGALPPSNPAVELPGSLAYLLPTSASTGAPKNTMIGRTALESFLTNGSHALEIGPGDVCLLSAPLTFAAGVRQSLMPLRRGASIAVADRPTSRDPRLLWNFIREHRVTFLDFVPSYWSVFIDTLAAANRHPIELDNTLDRVASVGERLSWPIPERWKTRLNQGSRFLNLYGQTETTGLVAVYETTDALIEGSVSVPVGRAIPETDLLVLDENMNEVPIGETGMLYVRSPSLMSGYLDRADLTEQQLVLDPLSEQPNGKLCRTGDNARRLSSGDLEVVGRGDDQVKVGGRRVELGEVETTLLKCPGVGSAAVVQQAGQAGAQGLVAFVVPQIRNAAVVDGHRRQRLANGIAVAIQSPSGNGLEAEAMYEEIFERQVYVKNGITIPNQGTVVDVGSNIGVFSLFVGLHYPRTNLYCFEPLAPIFEVLRINLELYGLNAKTFNVGLSHSPHDAEFVYYPEYSEMSGVSAYAEPNYEPKMLKRVLVNQEKAGSLSSHELLERADDLLEGRFRFESHTCRLTNLSRFISDEGIATIDVLKIDVQRAEFDVLAGVEDDDWERIKQIVMEVHDRGDTKTAGRTDQIRDYLSERGFEVEVEQDEIFVGTDRYNLYAWRPGLRNGASTELPETCESLGNAAVLDADDVRSYLAGVLPERIVPGSIVFLDQLPRTASGKVDRKALMAREYEPGTRHGWVAPRNPVEANISSIWQDVLGVQRVGVHDNFFELGGDSLSLIRVHNRLERAFGQIPAVGAFFELTTVAQISELFDETISVTFD